MPKKQNDAKNKKHIRLKDITISPPTIKEKAIMKDIKAQQKSTTFRLPSAPFQRLVSEILGEQDGVYQMSADAREVIHFATEQFLVNDVLGLAEDLKNRITKPDMKGDDLKPKEPRPTLFPRDMHAAIAADHRNDGIFKKWLEEKDKEEYEREKALVEKVSTDFVKQKRKPTPPVRNSQRKSPGKKRVIRNHSKKSLLKKEVHIFDQL